MNHRRRPHRNFQKVNSSLRHRTLYIIDLAASLNNPKVPFKSDSTDLGRLRPDLLPVDVFIVKQFIYSRANVIHIRTLKLTKRYFTKLPIFGANTFYIGHTMSVLYYVCFLNLLNVTARVLNAHRREVPVLYSDPLQLLGEIN